MNHKRHEAHVWNKEESLLNAHHELLSADGMVGFSSANGEPLAQYLRKKSEELFSTAKLDESWILLSEALDIDSELIMSSYASQIKEDPTNPCLLVHRARCYMLLKRLDDALADLTEAIALSGGANPKALLLRGSTWFEYAQTDETIPQDLWRKYLLKAIDDFDRCLEIDAEYAPAYNSRGNVRMSLHHFEQALEDYSKSVALLPSYAIGQNNLGVALFHMRRHDESLEAFDQCLELRPSNEAEVRYNRGLCLNELERFEEAAADLTFAIKTQNDSDKYFARGVSYLNLGKIESAKKDFDRALELDNLDPCVFYQRGLAQLLLGDIADAFLDFNRSIQLNDAKFDAFAARASTFLSLDEKELARRDYSRAQKLLPSELGVLAISSMLAKDGEYDNAITELSML